MHMRNASRSGEGVGTVIISSCFGGRFFSSTWDSWVVLRLMYSVVYDISVAVRGLGKLDKLPDFCNFARHSIRNPRIGAGSIKTFYFRQRIQRYSKPLASDQRKQLQILHCSPSLPDGILGLRRHDGWFLYLSLEDHYLGLTS